MSNSPFSNPSSAAADPSRVLEAEGIKTGSLASEKELSSRDRFFEAFRNTPIPDAELLSNIGLYVNRQSLSRFLYIDEIYRQIVGVHGVIFEFGVRWGQNLALFQSLRGIYEPFNYTRKIVGFDTFAGFPGVHAKDGTAAIIEAGAYGVTEGYEEYLSSVLDYHESESPLSHIKKYELVKGDAGVTVPDYLARHPETIISLAYFDFDIYEPTKKCLEAIAPYLTRGSIIGFDELNCDRYPGETVAVREVLGLDKYRIRRNPANPSTSYVVVE